MLLRPRLTIAFLSISVIPIILIGALTYSYVKEAMEQSVIDGLHEIVELQEANLFLYLDRQKTITRAFTTDGLIREAIERLDATPGNQWIVTILHQHLSYNKVPLNGGVYLIDILSPEGVTIASTVEERVGVDRSQQHYFAEGKKATYISDVHRHDRGIPEYEISAPIFSSTEPGRLIGVLVNHFSIVTMKDLFSGKHALELGARTQARGLGDTGETYLVNSDRLMITDSLFVEDASFRQQIDTYPVTMAIEQGREVRGLWRDYRGFDVVGASMTITIGDFSWILISEQNVGEAFATVTRLRHTYSIVIIISALFALWVSVIVSRKIVHPINLLKKNLEQGNKGRVNARITDMSVNDEIGFFARKFDDFQQQQEQLEALSNSDGLTGLFNHRHMKEHLETEFNRACRYKTPLCCILMDIDHFKSINDTHGHLFGDHVLQGVAEVIVDCCRKSDIMARYGGEEFVILLPNTELQQARGVAEKLFASISSVDYCDDEHRISITVSIGISSFNDEHQSYNDMLAEADEAMYQAKNSGRNRICVFGESDESLASNQE